MLKRVQKVVNRVLEEPAMLVGAVLAVGNLLGVDPESAEALGQALKSAAVFLGTILIRQSVTGPKDPLGVRADESG